MKIRNGFVSNSSSSSFIIAFKKKPESILEMQQILFDKAEHFSHPYERTGYSAETVAKYVYDDILDQKPKTKEEIAEEMGCGYLDDAPEHDNFIKSNYVDKENYEKEWEIYNKECKKFTTGKAERFLKDIPEHEIFIVEYSDNDGSFDCAMEHGDVFNRIPHIRISKH